MFQNLLNNVIFTYCQYKHVSTKTLHSSHFYYLVFNVNVISLLLATVLRYYKVIVSAKSVSNQYVCLTVLYNIMLSGLFLRGGWYYCHLYSTLVKYIDNG